MIYCESCRGDARSAYYALHIVNQMQGEMEKEVEDLPSFQQPETITGTLVRHLRDAILRGTIKKETRLLERELAERFKTSKEPVREALRELQVAGLVQITPHKGL